MKTFKKATLMAGVLAASMMTAGMAYAHVPNPVDEWVEYSGVTELVLPSGQTATCTTTLKGIIDVSTGDVYILAVGASSQDPLHQQECAAIYTGNLEWHTTMSTTGSGMSGSLAPITGSLGPNLPMVSLPAIGQSCIGPISGTFTYPDTITGGVPTRIIVNGSFSNGCTIQTTTLLGLELKI